ncbi:MAG: hypothetical protein ABIO19_08730 [Burkholderiaceae bacterium]
MNKISAISLTRLAEIDPLLLLAFVFPKRPSPTMIGLMPSDREGPLFERNRCSNGHMTEMASGG